MKLKTFLIVGCLGGLFTLSSCTAPTNVKDYSAYVNPFIGTGGHGHTFPGAVVPHGMIQPSPDTRIDGWDACSGYYYADSTINGFSHTHVSGTGCCDYGDVLLMPTVGKQQYRTTDPQSQRLAYASSFSHKNEIAEPGYYSVFLDTYQVKAEISSTKRGAIHRYTFPENTESGFIIDLDYSLQRQTNSEMEIEVISDTEICGHKKQLIGLSTNISTFTLNFPNHSLIRSLRTLSPWIMVNDFLSAKHYCISTPVKTSRFLLK